VSKGRLFFDFRHAGKRCREYTLLEDTPANRARMEKVLKRIEADIAQGTFDHGRYFPKSAAAPVLPAAPENTEALEVIREMVPAAPRADVPTFAMFADQWYEELEVGWRRSYRKTVRDVLDKHLLPHFGAMPVHLITKADLLQFRANLARLPGRKAGQTLSAKRVNAIMQVLKAILDEAADRFGYKSPFYKIKRLKGPRPEVDPFSLEEVKKILETVRADYRDYYTVRFFTGMRTGEMDGMKWKFVDFEGRVIRVRETIVAGEDDTTKTEYSQRDIAMSDAVYEAMQRQFAVTGKLGGYVFCSSTGSCLDHNNVTKRVWYPLLRFLGLKARRPYQTRHTAATLWLAAGENPEWIARQMGHANTQMLFTVYSRFVPNLTHRDGSAFERLMRRVFDPNPAALADAGSTTEGDSK
jgi:integrase